VSRREEQLALALIEQESAEKAREELKQIISKQKCRLQKNSRLYREMVRGPRLASKPPSECLYAPSIAHANPVAKQESS